MYRVIFYWDAKGQIPVRDLIESLPDKMRQKIAAWIDLLEKEGPYLRRPYADKVQGKIYELRIRLASDNIRILYFFFIKSQIVLLHGFRKKDWELKRSELETAERRMSDFVERYEHGKIKLTG